MKTFKNTQVDHENLPECSVTLFKVGEECPPGYAQCCESELRLSGARKLHVAAGYACWGWL